MLRLAEVSQHLQIDILAILIQRLLKENVDTYLMRSHLLNSLEMLPNNVGIVHGEENTVYPTVVAAQTADMMLSMEKH